MGNLVYIKKISAKYKQEIVTALNQAFELASGTSSLSGSIVENKENSYSMDIKVPLNENSASIFRGVPSLTTCDTYSNWYNFKSHLSLEVVKSGVKIEFNFDFFEIACNEKTLDAKEEAD